MPSLTNTIKERRYEMCRETLRHAENGDIEIATSAYTLAEVCKRSVDPTHPVINLAAFFDQKYILLIPGDKQIGLRAQHLQLAGVGKLKPFDAIHLASALVHNIPVFHTFDGALRDLDQRLTMADGNPLAIVRPTEEIPMPDLLKAMQPDESNANPN